MKKPRKGNRKGAFPTQISSQNLMRDPSPKRKDKRDQKEGNPLRDEFPRTIMSNPTCEVGVPPIRMQAILISNDLVP